ncbi:YccS family putative transporter [Pantoea sp. 1.19]|uniref:YccS family putative transporter n=1 Tax=Pantoea sp. 1.19 TaxID=1925589 RepID=UPI000948D525|nr:YccS family putative transporter [Pantoea sp. 1.19]
MSTLSWQLRRAALNSAVLYYLRIFFALLGSVGGAWLSGQIAWTIPLTLGVVAAALADLDDRLTGRLRNLVITLICFCIASVSVEWLFNWPLAFIVGLALSSWGFILLGALGQRYATIAFGALLIAVYTMLGIHLFAQWYLQPALLLTGAIWYNLLTLCGHLLFPIRPLQENLARCWQQLALYLDAKATLFDPDAPDEDDSALVDVAMANRELVSTLNQTKASIQSRLRGDRGQRGTRRTLHYYFVAQDIHERASSAHVRYQQLRADFRFTDILFRFQRILNMQAAACRQLAHALLVREPYQHNPRFERSFSHLQDALAQLKAANPSRSGIQALEFLLHNLQAIDAQLATIETEQLEALPESEEHRLSSEGLTGWHDIRLRLSRHLTPQSPLFRHATRMSLVLCVGYAVIQLTGLQHGYWILLTSLFVCQPNYSATQRRLALRILGTLAGVALGLPLLWLVPSVEGQQILIIVTGVLFFAFRTVQYAHATLFITLLVLFCFNLLGEGFEVALPRVIDTLIGCAIAWMAVSWIWPDWKFRQLPAVLNRALSANCRYLDAILVQYHQGRDNRLDYRIARRDAHNSNAEFASVVAGLGADKRVEESIKERAFALLALNHSLLSYVSTLGAHREQIDQPELLALLDEAVCYIDGVLGEEVDDEQAHRLVSELGDKIQRALASSSASDAPLMLQQLGLLVALLPRIVTLRKNLPSPT